MSTKAQVKANQQNAQKSTGPKSAQGKNVVSQNAVKHGLFAAEAVIKGEDPAEYEAFHDKFLAELFPVGMVETMLAERVISLWWRLRRAERMQNEAIDEMIENQIDNPMSKRFNMIKWHAKGVKLGDSRYVIDHLQLGRVTSTDWSSCRVLDRMMLYERRIENSVLKITNELKRQQIMHQIEQQDADEQYEPDQAIHIPIKDNRDVAATPSVRDEAATPSVRDVAATQSTKKKGELEKQTQYAPELIGVTPFVKRDYGNMPACGIEENKAKQSQSPAAAQIKGTGKKRKIARVGCRLDG